MVTVSYFQLKLPATSLTFFSKTLINIWHMHARMWRFKFLMAASLDKLANIR